MDRALFHKLPEPNGSTLTVLITVDGEPVRAEPGDSVASALLRLGSPCARTTPVSGSPRAPFCMMGVCFECLAVVDGIASTQTCLVPVREGLRVERQQGRRCVALDWTQDVEESSPKEPVR